MNHSSQSAKKVGVWVVDQQHLLRNRLGAGLPTVCNIMAYEARTRADAVVLAEDVKPDVILIDLGGQDVAGIKILHQLLTEHVYRDLLILSDKSAIQAEDNSLQEKTVAEVVYPAAVNQFTLALCRECSALLRSEPDMVHQLFRTWHKDCLERQVASTPRGRQLKLLVLTFPAFSAENKHTLLHVAQLKTRQVLLNQRERLHLSRWNPLHRSLKADLSHLFHCAKGWLSRSWRVTWQLEHPFKGSVQ